jgi:photosystem II stability/assembly factor-like uncharacterized protein
MRLFYRPNCPLVFKRVATSALALFLLTAASPRVVKGRCVGCQGPGYRLQTIQFITPQEGWANASQWWEGNGSGYATFLHTKDGGKHWHRVPFVWQVGAESPPPFAFVDRNRGFVEWTTPDDGVYHWSRTTDGGRTWRHREMNRTVEGMHCVQFFDARSGYGAGGTRFQKTTDGGITWHGVELPLSSVDAMSFADRNTGIIVGGTPVETGSTVWKGNARILVTHDGGATWNIAQERVRRYGEATAICWIDAKRVLLVLWGSEDSGSELLRSNDGGESWTTHPDRTFQGTKKYINEVAIAPDGRGYLFFSDPKDNFLSTTTDGGDTWKSERSPFGISSCQLFDGEIWCTSDMNIVKLDLPR